MSHLGILFPYLNVVADVLAAGARPHDVLGQLLGHDGLVRLVEGNVVAHQLHVVHVA